MKRSLITMQVLLLAMVPIVLAEDHDRGSAVSTAGPFTERAPGQLTTLFHENNGSAGNMFDIEPKTNLTEITALDINWTTVREVVEVEVYYKTGTCVGFDTDPSAWTLLSKGTGTAAGADLPTYIDIAGNGVSFDAGELYAIYVHVENYPALTGYLGYSDATYPRNYANYDLSATCYYGKGHPAFGPTYFFRIWNGTIHYDTGIPAPLRVDHEEIDLWYVGTTTFELYGGPDLANRNYGLLCTASGTSPGTPLPGGLVLPLNWDWATQFFLELGLSGCPLIVDFIGQLDQDGHAYASLNTPGHILLGIDILCHFAWCTFNPFDFTSNPVEILFIGYIHGPIMYFYDDGTSENSLGWTAGGEAVWAHYFDSGIGDWIYQIRSTFGQAGATNGPPNGTPCFFYLWDDPTDDNDPIDAVLLSQGSGVVANTNTNTFNKYLFDTSVFVEGGFFIGCHVWQDVGVYATPMDETTPYSGEAWFMGGAAFDPTDLSTTARYEMGSIGFPAYWLLRGNHW